MGGCFGCGKLLCAAVADFCWFVQTSIFYWVFEVVGLQRTVIAALLLWFVVIPLILGLTKKDHHIQGGGSSGHGSSVNGGVSAGDEGNYSPNIELNEEEDVDVPPISLSSRRRTTLGRSRVKSVSRTAN